MQNTLTDDVFDAIVDGRDLSKLQINEEPPARTEGSAEQKDIPNAPQVYPNFSAVGQRSAMNKLLKEAQFDEN